MLKAISDTLQGDGFAVDGEEAIVDFHRAEAEACSNDLFQVHLFVAKTDNSGVERGVLGTPRLDG